MKQSHSATVPPPSIAVEDALRSLVTGVNRLDADRAAAYGELSHVRAAKDRALGQREKIYALKYGAGHARVASVIVQRAANATLRHEIYLAHAEAATPAPDVAKDGFVFHGFVRDSQSQPRSRLTVALYDEKGEWLRPFGYGCTDDNGYFLLRYSPDKPARRNEVKSPADYTAQTAQAGRASETAGRPEEKKKNETPAAEMKAERKERLAEIRVYDANQKFLHRESEPLVLQPGTVAYREIILGEEGQCVPPPGSTANPPPVAKPPRAFRPPAARPSAPAAPEAPRPPAAETKPEPAPKPPKERTPQPVPSKEKESAAKPTAARPPAAKEKIKVIKGPARQRSKSTRRK